MSEKSSFGEDRHKIRLIDIIRKFLQLYTAAEEISKLEKAHKSEEETRIADNECDVDAI